MMKYCTCQDVKKVVKITPNKLSLDKDDTAGMKEIIDEWIDQATSLINSYINQSYDETCEDTDTLNVLRNVCTRLVANMIAFSQVRRDTPIIKNKDWTAPEISSDEIFTDNLKDDLSPFIKEGSNNSDNVGFYAVTGEDLCLN